MTIQAIDTLHPTTGTNLYTTKRNDEITKMDFLKLLLAQLQQQDPLNPQDPAEFTSQLTQFSSLEQMMAMNQSIASLQLSQLSLNNTMASSLIGKDVLYEGNSISMKTGVPTAIHYKSSTAVSGVTVEIYDSAGKLVRTLPATSAIAGQNTVQWDGLADDGTAAAAGDYSVKISAAGNSTALFTPLAIGHVSGIIFDNGETLADLGGKNIGVSDIISIYESTPSQTA